MIAIDPATLKAIHAVEGLVGRRLGPKTVRCRVRRAGVVVELDSDTLAAAEPDTKAALSSEIAALLPSALAGRPIGFEAYRNGSAFVGAQDVSSTDVVFDFQRAQRIGVDEAVLCEGKTVAQIAAILADAPGARLGLLLTRLDPAQFEALPAAGIAAIDYCAFSRPASSARCVPRASWAKVAIVAAGTSDARVAREAERTLRHGGVSKPLSIADVGVAGLWRLDGADRGDPPLSRS